MLLEKLSLLHFVLPYLVYALAVLAAWAWIPKRSVRLLVLAAAITPAVLLTVQVLGALSDEAQAENIFESECAKLEGGTVVERVQNVDGIGTEYFIYGNPRSESATKGNQIFGIGAWRDVLLGGHNGYQFVEEQLSPGVFEVHEIKGGRLASNRTQVQRSQLSINWQPLPTQMPARIDGLQLQILNRGTRAVIGSRAVLRLDFRSVVLPGTPIVLRPNVSRTCPRQVELVDFIKSVASPTPHQY